MLITLPLPHKHLSPNARVHHMVKHRAKANARLLAKLMTITAMLRQEQHEETIWGWQTATVRCSFFFRQTRRRDADNLLASLKSYFDGLADSGLIADDHGLTHLPVFAATDGKNPRVEIEIEKTTSSE